MPILDTLVQSLDNGNSPQLLDPDITTSSDGSEKMKKELADAEQKFTFDYPTAKLYLTELTSRWNTSEQVRTESNRLTRDIDVETDGLREEGMLEEDEAFIPDRVIDLNIQREMPSYINYLKNSRRVGTFKDVLDATFDTDLLEQEFTRVMTYKGWVVPFFKEFDSAMTHGWSSVEVLYDESKPGNAGIEYIAHEDLIFAQDSEDIQNCVTILRRYKPTPMVLKSWVSSFGFDFQQVMLLLDKAAAEKLAIDRTIEIYKRFCKYQGVVYVSWFAKESACTDWLKKPEKLYVGIDELQDTPVAPPTAMSGVSPEMPQPQVNQQSESQPMVPGMGGMLQTPQMTKVWKPSDVTNYPVFILPYKQTEKPYIFDFKGRVFYDRDKQEFGTAVKTAFCNGLNRSIKVFASPQGDPIADGKPAKMLANIQWQNGGVFDKQMNFYTMPAPNPLVLKAMQYMDDSNAESTGQTNYATMNREDSRKTATEVKASEDTSNLLDSVDLTLLSEHMRDILSFAWLIVRSQALQNRIKFLQIQNPQITQLEQPASSGQLPMGMAQQLPPPIQSIVDSAGKYQQESSGQVNDIDTIIRQFDVRAAGDVDVIQKNELVQQMMQDWPVVQQTALASVFLIDLMKLKYPMNADRYATILQSGNPKNTVIQSLGTLIQSLVKMPGVKEQIGPNEMKQLQMMEQQAQQALQSP